MIDIKTSQYIYHMMHESSTLPPTSTSAYPGIPSNSLPEQYLCQNIQNSYDLICNFTSSILGIINI